ncbi:MULTISPECIES: ParA family protein [Rhodomicrobium]|uniref:ParA family protein n=1 Tax=Rhodomicrobium TaxID=1068 RepID=UPI000B4B790C|nr:MULTISPECIES: ParA family protein [Rhodomicrobium]
MKVVPVFNMKGGVAKTTSSVLLAEGLAQFCGFRVLIVDADPQLNATRMVLSHTAIAEAVSGPQNRARTVARYLLKSVTETGLPDPRDFVLPKVGTIHGAGQIDLLAGTPRTAEVADTMLVAGANPGRTLENVLQRASMAFRKLNEAGPYDVILVDCPPGLTTIVRAALSAADLLIVPTTADDTAYTGIGNLVWHLQQHREIRPAVVENRRILVTRYQAAIHESNLPSLKRESVFMAPIAERSTIRDARLFSPHSETSFKGKYGGPAEKDFKKIIAELTAALGLARPNSVAKEPLPKDVIHVKGDQDSRELPNGADKHHGGKARPGKKISFSDLFSFSRRPH